MPEEQKKVNEEETPSIITTTGPSIITTTGPENNDIWINALVKRTPKGYSIWIPHGAFK